jgi:hypothetical protein
LNRPPAALLRQQRQPDGDDRKGQPHHQRVDDDNAEIAAPAQKARDFLSAAGRRNFPKCHNEQDSKKKGHPDQRFVCQNKVSHWMPFAGCERDLPTPFGSITFNQSLE